MYIHTTKTEKERERKFSSQSTYKKSLIERHASGKISNKQKAIRFIASKIITEAALATTTTRRRVSKAIYIQRLR